MKNGVPIGYVLFSSLFESTEVAFNVFDTFRGAEAAHVLSRVLAVGHRLFGASTFSIDPYQLGQADYLRKLNAHAKLRRALLRMLRPD